MDRATENESKKIRYAVIGLGNIAQVAVLPAFANAAENSELVALVSGSREKLQVLGERYGVAERGGYGDLEAILERARVDAVYIALPNTMHREFTERAARAGVHVLCEKPLAMTEEDCAAMIQATRRAGVKLMTAYRLHLEEANLSAVEIVRSGALGQARAFTSSFSHTVRPGDIRTKRELGGGALFDLGIYCVNAARYLFREEPIEVFGTCQQSDDKRAQGVDESTSATLRFPSGAVAQFTASQGLAPGGWYHVTGTKGDLRVEDAYFFPGPLKHRLTIGGKTTEQTFEKRDQFAAALVYFSRCILEDTEPVPSGVEGLADVRVMEAILRSAASGKAEALPPFERERRPDLSLRINKPALGIPAPELVPPRPEG
ncbi:Gfo/Idh/MocA family protein [Sorangium sp. So ce131]|uniref:Gfo/Idh/MocA family protein n=1 Tax=Sorangium sp. So ce131 TaxID=3133282 RepID=UPI003F5D5C11